MTSTALALHTPPVNWRDELAGAAMLLKSGLAPASLKTPEAAMYVILVGRDLGISATQSLRSINVIQGKVEVAADMQLALFKREGGRATWKTLTDTAAVLELVHANGDRHTESFTMEDAKRAGLSGDNWRKYPKAMLRSRCITAGMKSVGFDALAGVYAPGEIGGPESVEAPPASERTPEALKPRREAETVAAEVVDTKTGEVLSGGDEPHTLSVARVFPKPFGKDKGTEIGVLSDEQIEGAVKWATEKNPTLYAEFLAAAALVLADRADERRALAEESPRLSFEEAHPKLADEEDDLPF